MLKSQRYSLKVIKSDSTQKNKCDEKQEMYLLNFKEGKKIREEAQIRWRKFISKSNQYKLQYYIWNETEQTP